MPFIKYLLGIILSAYRDFEDRFSLVEEKLPALETVRKASLQKLGRFTKQDIRELCDGEQVRCLDPRPLYEDKNGYLLPDYSGDGVHPYGKYDSLLAQWLCQQVA